MSWIAAAPVADVFRRSESLQINESRLRRLVESRDVIRIAPGSYVWRRHWEPVTLIERHAQKVWEAAARLEPGAVFAYAAAAAVRGNDILGEWPTTIDVSVPEVGGGRSTGLVRRHSHRYEVTDVVPWGDHFLTSPARTVLDIAATRPFAHGVAAIDQALWEQRPGGPLLTMDELSDAADDYAGRGRVRARKAAEFAQSRASNVRESESRVLMHQLGFPDPVLQQRFELPSGRVAFSDFWWPDLRIAGELDGITKYLDPSMRNGRTPAQVLIDEKDREDELRRVVAGLARWRTPTLDHPAQLWDILTAAGLPSTRRRPAR
jgi:hypothetical protein